MSDKSRFVLKQQKRRYLMVLAGALIVGGFAAALLTDVSPKTPRPADTPHRVDLPVDAVNPQDIAMKQLEGVCSRLEQRVSYLQDLVVEAKRDDEAKERENLDLRQEIRKLKSEVATASQASVMIQPSAGTQPLDDDLFTEDLPFSEVSPALGPLQEYVMGQPTSSIANVSTMIPAGATVRAMLVSSLDAPATVTGSSDPHPVKLRILDNAHLPKGVCAKLKGAVLLASAYGDLSTERVYMRLERMTQFNPLGDFVETEVTGFVTGEDGRYGVRGSVVDRSKAMVKGAAASGFFSGLSEVLQAFAAGNAWRRNSNNVQSNVRLDVVKQGTLSGTASAFDQLADYYIQRAEQIQPVIQVGAGRLVDITFTHGAKIGELHTQDKVRKIRESTCIN